MKLKYMVKKIKFALRKRDKIFGQFKNLNHQKMKIE